MNEDVLKEIQRIDIEVLKRKGEAYGDSWKKRGGVGAFMMLARKWDRIENEVSRSYMLDGDPVAQYDIFEHVEKDTRVVDSLRDDIQDLRRYLLLVEGEIIARKKNV